MLNLDESLDKSVYIFCPEHRIIHYCYHFDYVFKVEKIIFLKNLEEIKNDNVILFIDQNLLKDFLNLNVSENINLFTILWNGDFDYKNYSKDLLNIKLKYKKFKIITQNNFNIHDKEHLSLNTFELKEKKYLKKVYGVSLFKKIKYFHPLIYSLYNFLRYFRVAKNLIFQKKIVFVGKADYLDTVNCIKMISRSNNDFTKKFCSKIQSDLTRKEFLKNFTFKELINDINFKNMYFHEKYYISNVIIRYLLISHLNKFKFFFHKNNTQYPLDLLNSNIYKNLTQLELGSKVGNSEIYSRRIMINKFYSNSFIKINFFENEVNYNLDNLFCERLLEIDKFFKSFFNIKNYDMSKKDLLINLSQLNINHLIH